MPRKRVVASETSRVSYNTILHGVVLHADTGIEAELQSQLGMDLPTEWQDQPFCTGYGWTHAFRTQLTKAKICIEAMLVGYEHEQRELVVALFRTESLIGEVKKLESRGRLSRKSGAYCVFVPPQKREEMTRQLMSILSP